MKVALTVSHERMAPCFAGVELWIVDGGQALSNAEISTSSGWHPLAWGGELKQRKIDLLICAGIAPGTWSAIRGNGIEVIPTAIGDPKENYEQWLNGRLMPPPLWPAYGCGYGTGRRRRMGGGHGGRRYRGGMPI